MLAWLRLLVAGSPGHVGTSTPPLAHGTELGGHSCETPGSCKVQHLPL